MTSTPRSRTGALGALRDPKTWVPLGASVIVALTLAACSSGSGSNTTTTTTGAGSTTTVGPAPSAPSATPSLTLADNHRTIAVIIPATIKVSLPYTPADDMSWQLVSGGAGFAMIGGPTFQAPASAHQKGTEVLRFLMSGHAAIPLVLDYAKAGTVPKKPAQQFLVNLKPS